MLTHSNWKFEKFISQKFNSNDLKAIEATSADNVVLHVEATVVWHVENPANAARRAADTMGGGRDTIAALTDDVKKQSRASLAMYIGELRYMDAVHMSSMIQEKRRTAQLGEAEEQEDVDPPEYSRLYDDERMDTCVRHANATAVQYGVQIVSINIVSATPADKHLAIELAQGALAAATSEQTETEAHAKAAAASIRNAADNDNKILRAECKAQCEVIKAEGEKEAADLVASSALACELQRLTALKPILADKTSYFFGSDPGNLSTLMSQK